MFIASKDTHLTKKFYVPINGNTCGSSSTVATNRSQGCGTTHGEFVGVTIFVAAVSSVVYLYDSQIPS